MGGVCFSCPKSSSGGGKANGDRALSKNGAAEAAALVDAAACGGRGEDGGAAKPPDEAERVGFLCGLGILDSPADPRFDDITKLLCTIFNVPIAIVSLVDTERQWFKSICGLSATETDRRSSFCAWTLLPPHPEVLVVPDARLDARFADNPLVVGEPRIRFYAGAPLVASNGARLGSLCVIDTVPRSIDAEQCNVLVNFAEVVMREIEKEKTRLLEAARLRSSAADLLRVIDGFRECVMLADAGGDRWPVLFVNDACARGAGVDPGADAGRDFWEMFALAGPAEDGGPAAAAGAAASPSKTAAAAAAAAGKPSPSKSPAAELVARVAAREAFHVELVRLPRKKGGGGGGGDKDASAAPSSSPQQQPPRSAARFAAHFRPASSAHLDGAPAIGIPTVASSHSLGLGAEGRGSSADALYFITLRFAGWGVRRPLSSPRALLSSTHTRALSSSPSSSSTASAAAKSLAQAARSFSETLPPRAKFGDAFGGSMKENDGDAAAAAAASASVAWDVREIGTTPQGAFSSKSGDSTSTIIADASHRKKSSSRREIMPEEPGEAAAASRREAESSSSCSRGGGEAGSANATAAADAAAAAAAAAADPLADVELGLLIGQGAYGRVYRGIWNGAPVAVKVIPHLGPAAGGAAAAAALAAGGKATSAGSGGGSQHGSGGAPPLTPRGSGVAANGSSNSGRHSSSGAAAVSPAPVDALSSAGSKGGAEGIRGALEMMHSVDLSHPGIVQTFKSAQRTIALPGPPTSASSSGRPGTGNVTSASVANNDSTSSSAAAAAAAASASARQAASRILTETWLVMEYCDRGSLQDAVDRGVFFERRGPAAAGGAAAASGLLPLGSSPPTSSGATTATTAGEGSVRSGAEAFSSSSAAPVPLGEDVDREKLLAGEDHSWDVVVVASNRAEAGGGGGGGAGGSESAGSSRHGPTAAASASSPSSPPLSPPTISTRPNMPFIVATATEIAAAMAYLHSIDVLHGDLTGGNVLLSSSSIPSGSAGGSAGGASAVAAAAAASAASASASSPPPPAGAPPAGPASAAAAPDLRGWTAKVADLGLARVLSCDAISTGTYGTVTHMPPELLTAGKLSKTADVYAFGVLLWEMLTGKRPWAGLLQMQVIFAVTIRRRRLAFPPGAREAHPRFVALAEECMAPEAERRPSFEEVLGRLREVEGAPAYVVAPPPPADPSSSAGSAAKTTVEEVS